MSKRVFNHPKEEAGGRKYWRSLGQLNDTPEFRQWMEHEFPQGASEFHGGEVSRRAFLTLMGASTALSGLSLTGCRRPEKHLVPFTKGVEWSIPGKALFYATAMPTRRGYSPLIATTYDSRPTKIEGNPLHPISNGATGLYEQASVLDLYDVDRVRVFSNKGAAVPEAEFEKALDGLLGKLGDGDGLAFLLQENNSPTRERLRGEIEKKFPKALWTVYEPVGAAAAVEAHQSAFGQGVMARPDFSKADVILSFDCDFLGIDGDIAEARAYAARRKADGGNKMNRLYVVENRYTVTGGMADHRLRAQASQVGGLLLELASLIGNKSGDASLKSVLGGAPTQGTNTTSAWLKECADDLIASRGKSLVLVGPRQSVAVQALALSINAALGNLGATLVGRRSATRPAASISALAKGLADKTIKTLVIVGGNPVYNAPADLNFGSAAQNAETVIRLSYHEDETSTVATWNVPLAHYLESWGDGLAADGSYVSVQPMILPLFGGWSELDILAKFAGLPKPKGPELIQATFPAGQRRGGFRDCVAAIPPRRFPQVEHRSRALDAQRGRGRCAGQGQTFASRRGGRKLRAGSRNRHSPGRRPLREQRLAPGVSRSHQQANVG
jgi:molybdopterin-containing oxidoreductase family iron-sulfur binding subunit